MLKTYEDFGFTVPSGVGEVAILCPECSSGRKKSKIKSLYVNRDKKTFYCQHCGFKGGLGGSGFIPEPTYRIPEVKVKDISAKAVAFFTKRGITKPVLERNNIKSGSFWFPQIQKEAEAIVFQYFKNGEVVNAKYRGADKIFAMEKCAERILYGFDDLAEETIIVEGEMDKLALEVAGYRNVVSVPNGASSKLDCFEDAKEIEEKVKSWIIAVDNDEHGEKLQAELARRLGVDICKKVTFPDGMKDANDVLVEHDVVGLRYLITNAEPFPVEGIFTARDVEDELRLLLKEGLTGGVSTGWYNLDKHYTVREGELTVVTGIPNSGKSNFIDALMVNLANLHEWQFALFSPENQPISDHMSRMIEKKLDKKYNSLSNADLEVGIDWCTKHFYWLLPTDDTAWTIENILRLARTLVLRKGIKGLVIDPFNEMEHERPKGTTESEYIGVILRRLRHFARQNGVHVWVIAHPAKLIRKNTDGDYPVPTPYDISGSANWRNKADNCLTVWRNFKQAGSPVQIYIQKIRFRQVGSLGVIGLDYLVELATYRETENFQLDE